jgi:sarcosine dehydrogenase
MAELPSQARAVVIGGGIVGCSTAYHLAKLGWTDIIIIERHKLTSGSTHHAAGLVGQLRSSANITQLLGRSVALYRTLEAETGLPSGWKMNGGLRLACNEARWTELRRQATSAHSFGLEMQLLTAREAQQLWPMMQVADVVGAAFLPTDGQVNPSDITQSLARGARLRGVKIFEDTNVLGFEFERTRVSAVLTARGRVACDIVVNCAGQWARQIGLLAGVNVPLVSVQHQYLITDAIPDVTPGLPTLRDPDRLTYFKEDVGALVMGGYEPNPRPWAVAGFPDNFNFQLLQPDWEHFQPILDHAIERVPALVSAGARELINGPESFTPDGNFILGAAPERDGFYVGAGFNAFGIASGGGAGQLLAEWIVGASTSGASGRRIAMSAGYERERWNCTASIIRSPGRARNTPAAGHCAVRRCTSTCAPSARCSARNSAGSGRTGSPLPASRPMTTTVSASRTGLRPSRASTRRRANAWRCSIRARSRNSNCGAVMPSRR